MFTPHQQAASPSADEASLPQEHQPQQQHLHQQPHPTNLPPHAAPQEEAPAQAPPPTLVSSRSPRPFLSPARQALHDYLLRVARLPYPPHSPIFMPAEVTLVFHKRIMVASHQSTSSNPATTTTECYYCTLTTRKIGRTYVLEGSAQHMPCWVVPPAGVPSSCERLSDHWDEEVLAGPVLRRMVLEKREGDRWWGPDPGWGDLKRVLVRETQLREGAYFVDGRTGVVEGLDT